MRTQAIRRFTVAAAFLGLLAALTAAAQAPVPRSVVTNDNAALQGVSADSADDGWAVGIHAGKHVVLHWNGTSWAPAAVPLRGLAQTAAVSALSPRDAWIVGAGVKGGFGDTLALHWNGSSWTRVHTPSPGKAADLTAVSAQSATDVWAVGDGSKPSPTGPLSLHWNGTKWTQVPMPHPAHGTGSGLTGVSAISRSDAWAVGENNTRANLHSLIEHWNGSRWTLVRSPDPGRTYTDLEGVSALSGNDAWAVGSYFASTTQKTLVLHWNGRKWTHVTSPNVGRLSVLAGVVALSPSDAWAVGWDVSGTLVLHWNGHTWTRVANPNPGGGLGILAGVSAASRSDAWAVGYFCKGGNKNCADHTIILHWNGRHWVRS